MPRVSVVPRSAQQMPRGYSPIPEMHKGSAVTGFFPRGERFALAPRAGVKGKPPVHPEGWTPNRGPVTPAHDACLVVAPAKLEGKWSLDTRLALLRGMRRDHAARQGTKAQTLRTMGCD